MKKFMTFIAMVVIATIAMAQSETTRTIHGAVIDKNGNPLPGATVSATEGAETTLVNADGTFKLEIPMWLKSVTASYAGYKNKKMKPQYGTDMIFRLKKDNKSYGFLNAFGGVNFYNYHDDRDIAPTMGLMGGMLGNVGFYVKFGFSIHDFPTYIASDDRGWNSFNGCEDMAFIGIAGVTKRIYKNFYAYVGVGYGGALNNDYDYDDYGYDFYGYKEDTYHGMAFDAGFLLMIGRHFNVSAGYTQTTDFAEDHDGCNFIPNISFGYVF